MTVITAVDDWMMPVIKVPAMTPLTGVPAYLASISRIRLTRKRLNAVCHEVETEHENAKPADNRNDYLPENIHVHHTLPTLRSGKRHEHMKRQARLLPLTLGICRM